MSEEAEEWVIVPVTLEVVEPNRGATKSLTERLNTNGSPSQPSSEEVVSRYLRASTGSCHDLCKYGIKHGHEAKKRRAKFPRNLGDHSMLSKEHSKTEVLMPQGRKKSGLNLSMSPQKNELNDEHKVVGYKDLPPEKIIRLADSYTNHTEESVEESSKLKSKGSLDEQLSYDHSPKNQSGESSEDSIIIKCITTSPTLIGKGADKHEALNPPDEISTKPVSIEDNITIIENASYLEMDPTLSGVEESSPEPASIKFMISVPTQESNASPEGSALDQSDGSSDDPISRTIVTTSPMESRSVEDATASGAERSPNKPISDKYKILLRSQEGSTSKELKKQKCKASAKQRPGNQLEGAKKGASRISSVGTSTASALRTPTEQRQGSSIGKNSKREVKKLNNEEKKTTDAKQRPGNHLEAAKNGASRISSVGKSTASALRTPTEQHQGSSIGKNSKREVKKVKNEEKKTTDARPHVTQIVGPRTVKKNIASTSKEAKKPVKQEIKLKRSTSTTKTAATILRKAVLKKTLSSSKADVSVETATSLKLKKLLLKSSYSSISLGRLTGCRNKEKVIKVAENSNGGDQVTEPSSSTSLSTKPCLNAVSSMKTQKYHNRSPSSTVKNQTKAGRLGLKEKSLYISQPKAENIDLKAIRQKLRKPISYSTIRQGGNEGSRSKSSEVKKSLLRTQVNVRNSGDTSKVEIKKTHRRTASTHSTEKFPIPRKLNFIRGKIVNVQPENNNPIRLRFRRAKTVTEYQNAKVRSTSTGESIEPGDAGSSLRLLEAPSIVLRHQDIHDKKETQGLFNLVIEETASKLVESRKSKVKALVGAFETVISLQESKAAPVVSIS